jgi:peptidoglycan hydrolase-like protein with peptidoglycan-binding domain
MRPIRLLLLIALCLTTASSPAAASAGLAYWDTPVRDSATVAALEEALRAAGYDPGPADGALSRKTEQALKQAQQDRELPPTGRPDRRTLAALGLAN